MRWLLAGLLFALAVALAIGTAAIRAENVLLRHQVERDYRTLHDREVEWDRLVVERLVAGSPERLARAHWQHLREALAHQQGRLQ